MRAFVIGPGNEQAIQRMLVVSPASGHVLRSVRIEPARVVARYARAQAGSEVELVLEAVRERELWLAPHSPAPPPLRAELEANLRRWQSAIEWTALDPKPRTVSQPQTRPPSPPPPPAGRAWLDPEHVALAAGIKPALRLRPPQSHFDAVAQQYRAEGFAVVRAATTLYVARSERPARELYDLESTLARATGRARNLPLQRRVGELLGYPACCIEAFLERCAREPHPRAGRLARPRSEAYFAAQTAWVARPHPRLNTLLGGEGARIVSFEPCRFDCAAATVLADAICDALAREDATRATELDRQLARAVVILPDGTRAVVRIASGRVRAVAPVRPSVDATLDARVRRRLLRLEGERVGERGALPGSGLLVDFSRDHPCAQ